MISSQSTLIDGAGADTFVLGDASRIFYYKSGVTDYALILDFNLAEDKLPFTAGLQQFLSKPATRWGRRA